MLLDLTLEQVNLVLGALGNAPFAQVEVVITEIREQAQRQLTLPPEPTTES